MGNWSCNRCNPTHLVGAHHVDGFWDLVFFNRPELGLNETHC